MFRELLQFLRYFVQIAAKKLTSCENLQGVFPSVALSLFPTQIFDMHHFLNLLQFCCICPIPSYLFFSQ